MRRDGDLLIEHVRAARKNILLCAPFIKANVISALLTHVPSHVSIRIVTRWKPEEVAAGVSDLKVFEIVQARENCTLHLLDNLHAKLYLADEQALVGSANLTGRALGWASSPNIEILAKVNRDDDSIIDCLRLLNDALPATQEEMERIQNLANGLILPRFPESAEADIAISRIWLPTLSAPARLFEAYVPLARERLTQSVILAADHDLAALNIAAGLNRNDFFVAVKTALKTMVASGKILEAARLELPDASGAELIKELAPGSEIAPGVQWAIMREWITHFFTDEFEIAPQSFIIRLKN